MKNSIIISLAIAGMSAINLNVVAQSNTTKQNQMITSPTFDFKTDMRILWEENTTLTHNVILCIVDNKPGIDEARDQLVKNQAAIGKTVTFYYGAATGKKLTSLLYSNITIAADAMIATRNGNHNAYDKADKKWKESTDETLAFLGQTNSNWNMNDMKAMMYGQIQFVTDESTDVKSKNFNGCAKAYDDAFVAVVDMANSFSDGIIKQFPGRFPEFTPAVTQK